MKETLNSKTEDINSSTDREFIVEVNHEGIITFVTPSVKDIFGFEIQEALGKSYLDFLPADYLGDAIFLNEHMKTAIPKTHIKNKDGGFTEVDTIIVSIIYDEDLEKRRMIFTSRDVTVQRKAFIEVERKDKLLRAVSDATHLLITNTDTNNAIVSALEILGKAVEVDRVYIFQDHVHPQTGRPATSQRYEWVFGHVDPQISNPVLQNVEYQDMGLLWWYESLIKKIPINGIVRQMSEGAKAALGPQGIISILVLPIYIGNELWGFIGFDDCHKERVWSDAEESILTAVAASFGAMVKRMDMEQRLQTTLHELSQLNETLEEKVQAAINENQQKEMMLQQQSRQVAMGEIINSIAHQWRQPLNAVSLMASNIVLDAELDGPKEAISNHANQIIQQTQNMSQTITDFMDFFNGNSGTTSFYIKDVIKGVFDLFQSQIYSRNITLEKDCIECHFFTYRNDLQQVLINVIANAIQAFEGSNDNKLKVIKAKSEKVIDASGNKFLKITLQDNAGGIPESIIGMIFKPYFTTKPPGKGTGLGLSISKKIVEERLNGTIEALNLDGGATFIITIPNINNEEVDV